MTLSTRAFLERLTASGVVDDDTKKRLESSGDDDPRRVADELVSQGVATRFQVERLLSDTPRPVLLGEHLLLEELGAGGMGTVYKARHRRMGRLVAVKVLAPELTRSAEAVERFHREVRAVGRLQHPNVVLAFDASESNGEHYLVMELVEGRDVGRLLEEQGTLPIGTALRIAAQAAGGLAFAHENGIIHRDVKPANLLLTSDGVVKLLDLGIARLRDADAEDAEPTLTQTGSFLGTVAYMAPEHASNPRDADERSDIYSLGCTLYRMLTGRLPYTGRSAVELLFAARDAPLPDLREHFPAQYQKGRFLAALQEAFARLAAKDPDDRPQTMAEAGALLTELVESVPEDMETVRALPPAATTPPRPPGDDVATVGDEPPGPTRATERPSTGGGPGKEPPLPAVRAASPAVARDPLLAGTTSPPPARRPRPPRPETTSAGARETTGVAPRPSSRRGPLLALLAVAALVAIALAGLFIAGLRSGDGVATTAASDGAAPSASSPTASGGSDAGGLASERTDGVGASAATPPEPTPIATEEGGVDLLAAHAAGRSHVPFGEWSEGGDGWTSSAPAALVVPAAVPASYVAEATFIPLAPAAGTARAEDAASPRTELPDETQPPAARRLDATGLPSDVEAPVAFHLGTLAGTTLLLEIDREGPDGAVFSRVVPLARGDATPPADARALAIFDGRVLGTGRPYLLEAHVHPRGVSVWLDGRRLLGGELPEPLVAAEDPEPTPHAIVTAGALTLRSWRLLPRAAPPDAADAGVPRSRVSVTGAVDQGAATETSTAAPREAPRDEHRPPPPRHHPPPPPPRRQP